MFTVNAEAGISGEFQVVVRRADGSVRFDSGLQKNLFLDNGLKALFAGEPITNSLGIPESGVTAIYLLDYCVVGDGNTPPAVTDIALSNYVANTNRVAEGSQVTGVEQPESGKHEGFVKQFYGKRFVFSDIKNKNISEVGLSSIVSAKNIGGTNHNNVYYLYTRALIKDSGGSPISVTVQEGELLEVYYQLNRYVDIRKKEGTFRLSTYDGGTAKVDTFEYVLQAHDIRGDRNIVGQYGRANWGTANYAVSTYGVKEADAVLSAAYDIKGGEYAKITHLDTKAISSLTTGELNSNYTSTAKESSNHLRAVIDEVSYAKGEISVTITNGVYTHIHDNGIRAFGISYLGSGASEPKILVVVKDRLNGQGIKKLNSQEWDITYKLKISRWED